MKDFSLYPLLLPQLASDALQNVPFCSGERGLQGHVLLAAATPPPRQLWLDSSHPLPSLLLIQKVRFPRQSAYIHGHALCLNPRQSAYIHGHAHRQYNNIHAKVTQNEWHGWWSVWFTAYLEADIQKEDIYHVITSKLEGLLWSVTVIPLTEKRTPPHTPENRMSYIKILTIQYIYRTTNLNMLENVSTQSNPH
jgi:hypothetical protein